MASVQATSTRSATNKRTVGNHQVQQDRDRIRTKITNTTQMPMTLLNIISWAAGSPPPDFPPIIAPNDFVMFDHMNLGSFGSKAAVIYSGMNQKSVQCAWVLAFDSPTTLSPPQFPNRVYVTCGPKSEIEAIPLDQFKMMLEQASDIGSYNDPETNTLVSAKYEDQVPVIASLEATFGLI